MCKANEDVSREENRFQYYQGKLRYRSHGNDHIGAQLEGIQLARLEYVTAQSSDRCLLMTTARTSITLLVDL